MISRSTSRVSENPEVRNEYEHFPETPSERHVYCNNTILL